MWEFFRGFNNNEILMGFAGILEFEYKNTKEYEFGFVLAKDFWGKGYATKIGKAQIDFAFRDMGLKRIYALTNPKNIASKAPLPNYNPVRLFSP